MGEVFSRCVTRAFSQREVRESVYIDSGTINPPGRIHRHVTITLRNRFVTKSAIRLNGAPPSSDVIRPRVTFHFEYYTVSCNRRGNNM